MRKSILALSVASALVLAGCGSSKQELHLFTWTDYVDPEVIEQFEREFDCRVVIDIFDSNESMLSKITAGATGYDVLVPSSYMVEQLAKEGMVEALDKSKLPNLANIDPAYLRCALDPEMKFGIPYMVTYTGIAWRDDRLTGDAVPEESWSVFEREDIAGRITLLGDMRETLGAALLYKGHKLNSVDEKELAEARDVVIGWKKNIAKFENEQYKTGVAGGEFVLVHGYSGDIGQVQLTEEGGTLAPDLNHVRFFLPKEGFSVSCDELVIPTTAPNKELAYKFLNFMHDADIAARNIEYTTYWCPNTPAKALLREQGSDAVDNPIIFIDEETLARGQVIGYVGENLKLYTRMWDQVLAAEGK